MRMVQGPHDEGIITKDSRKLLRKSLRSARRKGHRVQLICKSGSMELYGCLHNECRDTLDCWDSPSVCNGTLHRRKCQFACQSRGKNFLPSFYLTKDKRLAAGSMLKNIFKFCFYPVRWLVTHLGRMGQ